MPELVAILCSGQGGQHPAMFDLVADCPEAEPVMNAAAAVLGRDPRSFVKEATPADLFSDFSGQILCCTQALAAWAALGTVRPARAVNAGYSIGELAAWGCAGALNELSALRLAQRRAAVMDAEAPIDSGLAAITGLRRPVIEPILTRHALSIAIVNDVDSFTVGGPRAALRAACEEAAARGAKRTVTLPVTVPSHTPLLSKATEQFRVTLREASPRLEPYGVDAVSRRTRTRRGGIPQSGRTADVATTSGGLMRREGTGGVISRHGNSDCNFNNIGVRQFCPEWRAIQNKLRTLLSLKQQYNFACLSAMR
jgi:[acyl-carrier-protein] S-malonyltransferase